MVGFEVGLAKGDDDLQQILKLQQQNHKTALSPQSQQEQGFITVLHTLPMLQQMHQLQPSPVAVSARKIIGYALCMPPQCRTLVPELVSMFAFFDTLVFDGKPLTSYRYYAMGQICIDESWRGMGVFDALYKAHYDLLHQDFDLVITEIATRNTRSRRAHERVGFETIDIYRDELDEWAVVIWDWRNGLHV